MNSFSAIFLFHTFITFTPTNSGFVLYVCNGGRILWSFDCFECEIYTFYECTRKNFPDYQHNLVSLFNLDQKPTR